MDLKEELVGYIFGFGFRFPWAFIWIVTFLVPFFSLHVLELVPVSLTTYVTRQQGVPSETGNET